MPPSPVTYPPHPDRRLAFAGPTEFGAPPGMPGVARGPLHLERGHIESVHDPRQLREPEGPGIDTRILIGTSLAAFAHGLRPWLESPVRGWRVVSLCTNQETFYGALEDHEPAVIVVTDEFASDVALPLVVDRQPEARIVVMALAGGAQQEAVLVRQGASAVLPASSSRSQTIDAVEAVLDGRAVVSAAALKLLSAPLTETPGLTKRQRDVLERLAMGCTTAQIAQQLVVTQSTVKTHIKHIQERFGVPGQLALVANAHSLLRSGTVASPSGSVNTGFVS